MVGVTSRAFGTRFVAGAAVCALLLAGCSNAAPSTESSSVTVVVGLYSGRSDPSFVFTAAQAKVLDALMATLPTRTGVPITGGLGYHGFTISRGPADVGSSPSVTVAFRGQVAELGSGAREIRIDDTRNVEATLLNDVRAGLTAEEIAIIEQDLNTTG